MYHAIVKSVLQKYGLEYIRIFAAQKGYRNESYQVILKSGEKINVLFYKREAQILQRIRCADLVSQYLSDQGMPTRVRFDKRTVRLSFGTATIYIALYNYLPGQTIPWEAYTQEHLKLLGKTQSDMHKLLQTMPNIRTPAVVDEYHALLSEMQDYFRSKPVRDALKSKLEIGVDTTKIAQLQLLLNSMSSLSHQQVLHMDFVRGNVLFSDNQENVELSGVIDFEKVAFGHPVFDIARTLAFLLVDCKYKTADQIRKYFLYSGYQKRGQNTMHSVIVRDKDQKINLLDRLVVLFMMYDFYKFLCHNPYEYLQQNEHFVRTRDILVEYNMIHCT